MSDPLPARLAFALDAFRLKDETRRGWVLRDVSAPESVADHSWGTALLCLLYAAEAGVELGRALAIATVHDLAEAITGDVATRADEANRERDPVTKSRLEREAMASLLAEFDGSAIASLWEAYETDATPEALFVRDMNLIDMCLQALLYQRERRYPEDTVLDGYRQLDEFFVTAAGRLGTGIGRRLFQQIERSYREAAGDSGDS